MAITETGFERPIQSEILDDIASDLRGTISAQLDMSESTVIGNVSTVHADKLAQAYEVLEEAYNGMDPDNATDSRLEALSALTGTIRRPAAKGSVTVTCTLGASKTFAPEDLQVHAFDDPTNRWLNRDIVETTTEGDYEVVFLSESAGSAFTAAANTLTVIASPIDGFSAATNAEDATPGRDRETIEELRVRRESELALGGSGTLDAIRADVQQVEGVIQVLVEENTLNVPSGGLGPHAVHVVVWDGDPGQAENDAIAQAIFGTVAAGITVEGSLSGVATRSDGTPVTRRFDRADVVDIYIEANIVSEVGVLAADVKAALVAAMPQVVGGDVKYNRMSSAVFIEGVDDFVTFFIGTAPSPVGTTNIAISSTQIAQLDPSNITLVGDVS